MLYNMLFTRHISAHVTLVTIAALRVLKCLNTVQDPKLTFRGGLRHDIQRTAVHMSMYSDFDWAMGSTSRRMYSVNVIYFNDDLVCRMVHPQTTRCGHTLY